ncbi:MAG: dephospho-CoA kinase [Lachnospiraceae bacterium]|nr:dephospho-CoA kinase [Lachnospiraceae bacterium]
MLYVIGITGGVGAGKTEILSYIRRHYSCRIYLADEVAHLVKLPGTECFDKLLVLLGSGVLDSEGKIDSRHMAEKIFGNEELLSRVNGIIHPAVRLFIGERLEEAKGEPGLELFFIEAALLIEAGYRDIVDEMWYIYADENVRRRRLRDSRGYSDSKTEGIINSQLSDREFRENCDFVIDNSGELNDSYEQIKKKLEAFTWQG